MLLLGPAIREFDSEESAVGNEDVAMNVHGNGDAVFGGEGEFDVAGGRVVELVTGAAGGQQL